LLRNHGHLLRNHGQLRRNHAHLLRNHTQLRRRLGRNRLEINDSPETHSRGV
jgi:hypothetical protein